MTFTDPAGWRGVSGADPFDSQMRVLHVAQPVDAGVAGYVEALSRFQVERGWDVHVATGAEANVVPGVTRHLWAAARSPVHGVRSESAVLATIIDLIDPAVVVLHSAKAGLVGRLVIRASRPTVYLPHAWSFLALSAKLAPAALNWERQAARWTNAVIAVSDAEAELTVERGIHVPLFVVRNPVPPGWPQVDAADRAAARSELGLGDAPLAVSVGRLSRQKGHDVLIEAWPQVLQRVPQAQLVIVGDGELRAQLENAGTPGVTFAGSMPDPRPWVSAADLVVLPSRWEGMSLAMLEALAAGRSVVTTDVAGSEVVTRSGAGAVVPVEDPTRLADALAERLSGQLDTDAEGRLGADHARLEHDRNRSLTRASAVISRAHAFGRLRDAE
ncbi:MAG: hypothetical protein QG671_4472 [Actinomycetota bacterium]|nr:hypothetical protein [Actinomycetota bacterium]